MLDHCTDEIKANAKRVCELVGAILPPNRDVLGVVVCTGTVNPSICYKKTEYYQDEICYKKIAYYLDTKGRLSVAITKDGKAKIDFYTQKNSFFAHDIPHFGESERGLYWHYVHDNVTELLDKLQKMKQDQDQYIDPYNKSRADLAMKYLTEDAPDETT